jgi:hypothetical protein
MNPLKVAHCYNAMPVRHGKKVRKTKDMRMRLAMTKPGRFKKKFLAFVIPPMEGIPEKVF